MGLTVLHEHHQMHTRKGFVHQRCGWTSRLHPVWRLHLVPERTRVWTHCAVGPFLVALSTNTRSSSLCIR